MTDQPRWPAGTPIRPDGGGPGGGRYRPTTGYAGSWVQQLSDRIAPPGRMSHEQLVQYVGRDDYEVIGGGGGGTSDVVFRRYSDGRVLVYKRFHGTAMPAVAEVEASLIGQAIGAPVPAALRDPDHEYSIYMEYVEADPQHAHENYRGGGVYAQRRLALIDWMDQLIDDEHPDALMLGLLDVLIGNADRHPMNVVRTPGDHIVGIDHGEAFWADYFQSGWPDIDVPAKAMAGAGRLGRRLLKYDANTDQMSLLHFSAGDIRRVRERLAPLRPLLRDEVGDGLFRALDTLERVATGTGRHVD